MSKKLKVFLLLASNNFFLIATCGMLETAILQLSVKWVICSAIFAVLWWLTSSLIFVGLTEVVTKMNSNDEVKND